MSGGAGIEPTSPPAGMGAVAWRQLNSELNAMITDQIGEWKG
jgi:hypothetical protein